MEPTQTESWRPVVGYEGAYEVSDLGRIRGLPRTVSNGRGGTKRVQARIRIPQRGTTYLHVEIGGRTRTIHSLVAEAFIGSRPEGYHICHNNGDPHDNRVSNLRYDTPSANGRDTVEHGHHPATQRTHCPQGHPYDEANTGRNGRARRCLACHRAREAARSKRKALADAQPL